MKQLMILSSEEILDQVKRSISHAQLGCYAEIGSAYGHHAKDLRFVETQEMTWPASMFVILGEDEAVAGIVAELKQYAGSCDVKPCLQLIVTDVVDYY